MLGKMNNYKINIEAKEHDDDSLLFYISFCSTNMTTLITKIMPIHNVPIM